jgi:hypothetical protein
MEISYLKFQPYLLPSNDVLSNLPCVIANLFTSGLFTYTLSNSDYKESNGRIDESTKRFGKNLWDVAMYICKDNHLSNCSIIFITIVQYTQMYLNN